MIQLALGSTHSCALGASGLVWCWGQNEAGQLGTGGRQASWRPSQVRGLVDVVEIQTNRDTTCARDHAGRVFCWGSNQSGQASPPLGSDTQRIEVPGAVSAQVDWAVMHAKPFPERISGVTAALGIAVGQEHACALLQDGTVTCWGDNRNGQLSLAAPRTTLQRARVSGLPKAIAIQAAGTHTCAITEDKHVWCWGGHNEFGLLGTTSQLPTLRKVPGVSGALALESDTWRVCARVPSGFDCWGEHRSCFADDIFGPPVHFKLRSNVSQLVRATEACASCVLLQSAQVKCTFMLTNGRPVPEREVLPNASALAAGDQHFCALVPTGKVACWGHNHSGQLGQPPSSSEMYTPQLVNWEEGQ
ncbi:MAG: hypothetical protein ABJB12_15695 [Pseudomonadota bacterium]